MFRARKETPLSKNVTTYIYQIYPKSQPENKQKT